MPHFFLKLVAPRPTFSADMSEAEKKMMQEHVLYWKGRQDRGEVIVFGPVMDPAGPYGMGVIEAADDAGARAFIAGDPAMRANCGFKCEIYPMRAVTRETVN
ncbi:MAG TPA: YciI family protein [Pseudolabrys sp.]|nr:YciI family protein [Pseudolabrys sp.]